VRIATISGTASEVGKTTLLCALLERLPGWAAVKVTRGHYRSCGRDPDTCCVSHLLGDEPRVFSDRETTDVPDKDTGRYWAAGAADVRWVVAASGQEIEGLRRALADLTGVPGVLVEGNRIVRGCRPDLAIMVASPGQREVKATARRILGQIDALYVPDADAAGASPESVAAALVGTSAIGLVWGPGDLDAIAARLATPGA
jgi:molybdopterin-guanine dinucleotide biosynthesis protein